MSHGCPGIMHRHGTYERFADPEGAEEESIQRYLQLRALCSRLSAHHLLSPWTFEEIQTYLKTGLEAVGIQRSKMLRTMKEGVPWTSGNTQI